MPTDNNRNFLIFIVVTMILVLVYDQFVIVPADKRREAQAAQAQAAAAAQAKAPTAPEIPKVTRSQALATSPRVLIDTPQLSGSISLTGARLDDLYLKQYRETTAANSPPVELL